MFSHKQDSHFQAVPVKEMRKKGSEGPLRLSAQPQRWKHPVEQPILHQCLQRSTLWRPWASPAAARAPWSLRQVPVVTLVVYGGDGVLAFVLRSLKCQLVSCRGHKLQGPGACTGAKSQPPEKGLPAPSGCEAPTCPCPHSSKFQDTTDWIDAEDVPFLWFFCLFWVYTIIKKSLVLAGNLKNKTKQRNHPPLAYSSSIMTWLSFFSTLRVGIEGWKLHSKKKWKGRGCSF